MTTTVGEMSPSELRNMIDSLLDQKLRELLGDPDEGLQLREEIVSRLQKQRRAVDDGERGKALDDILLLLESD